MISYQAQCQLLYKEESLDGWKLEERRAVSCLGCAECHDKASEESKGHNVTLHGLCFVPKCEQVGGVQGVSRHAPAPKWVLLVMFWEM
ncbi:hypothetical protein MAR_002438 [Mya arenaria]|uniref:LIM zinc-binding domain-containing protein n=1 Tax=Mya arenaria TaxID=6604 RepID=A0ABY7FEI2_MYAAR|nr:hypothetical protein MAR_002438 [Mya arenaria]